MVNTPTEGPAYNTLLEISEDTPGQYKCIVNVSGSNIMSVVMEERMFQIVGKFFLRVYTCECAVNNLQYNSIIIY